MGTSRVLLTDGVTRCKCCGRAGHARWVDLNQATSEETWYSRSGDHKQERGVQEVKQQIPTPASTPREKLFEVSEETAMSKQRAKENELERGKMKSRKPDACWTCLEMTKRESEQERCLNPHHDHTPKGEVSAGR